MSLRKVFLGTFNEMGEANEIVVTTSENDRRQQTDGAAQPREVAKRKSIRRVIGIEIAKKGHSRRS